MIKVVSTGLPTSPLGASARGDTLVFTASFTTQSSARTAIVTVTATTTTTSH
jgi:hypothetical protein